MMPRTSISLAIAFSFFLVACETRTPVANPDPNHAHADFAVWIDGEKLDFSVPEFMSEELTHEEEEELKHDTGALADATSATLQKYLHLHDGNGHVMHRHKPSLTLANFFTAIRVGFAGKCYSVGIPGQDGEICSDHSFRLFVNGKEYFFDVLSYVFVDGDKILITTAVDGPDLDLELASVTDDACRYSKTCPWRGDPPAEGCIADPDVPCTQ